jgi:hypothetical protein
MRTSNLLNWLVDVEGAAVEYSKTVAFEDQKS